MKTLFATAAVAAALAATPTMANDIFVTGNIGSTDSRVEADTFGVAVRQDRKLVDFEATYDRDFDREVDYVGANALLDVPFRPLNTQPYLLAGVGYAWTTDADEATWQFGGGVRYPFSDNTGLDLRYREVAGFETSTRDQLLTLGFSFKF